MKCDKCGNTIDSDDLVCRFCGADIQSHVEDIEVLDEVEENPSIVFSENISIEDLSVAKPKKKRKKKKKKKTDSAQEADDEKIEEKETKEKVDKKKSKEKASSEETKTEEEKNESKKDVKEESNGDSISEVLENIYEERSLENKKIKVDSIAEEETDIDDNREETVEKQEDTQKESDNVEQEDKESLEEKSEDNIDDEEHKFREVKVERVKLDENDEFPDISVDDNTEEEPQLVKSEEVKEEDSKKEKEPAEENKEPEEEKTKEVEGLIAKELVPETENTVYDIPKIISSEEVTIESTQEPEESYQPFVNSDDIVPLPPKKTIFYRIKDFYNSLFEGYEKANEIQIDDRETRLTLDKIYDNNAKKLRDKKIQMNEVVMVWLICFVFAFFSFFVFTSISFIVDIAFGSHNNIPLLMYIIPFFQIGIPSFLTLFGWLLGFVYSVIKHSKKSNR